MTDLDRKEWSSNVRWAEYWLSDDAIADVDTKMAFCRMAKSILAVNAYVGKLEKVAEAAKDALLALQNEDVLNPGKYLAARELLEAALAAMKGG